MVQVLGPSVRRRDLPGNFLATQVLGPLGCETGLYKLSLLSIGQYPVRKQRAVLQ